MAPSVLFTGLEELSNSMSNCLGTWTNLSILSSDVDVDSPESMSKVSSDSDDVTKSLKFSCLDSSFLFCYLDQQYCCLFHALF